MNKLAILPVQVNNGFDNFSGKIYISDLIATVPCINISLNNTYKQGIPCIFSNGKWHKIYNDKR